MTDFEYVAQFLGILLGVTIVFIILALAYSPQPDEDDPRWS